MSSVEFLLKENSDLRDQRAKLTARIVELEKELSEQARLVGMASEREAKLETRIRELEAAIETAKKEIGVPQPDYPAPIANAYHVLNEPRSGAPISIKLESIKIDMTKGIAGSYGGDGGAGCLCRHCEPGKIECVK